MGKWYSLDKRSVCFKIYASIFDAIVSYGGGAVPGYITKCRARNVKIFLYSDCMLSVHCSIE